MKRKLTLGIGLCSLVRGADGVDDGLYGYGNKAGLDRGTSQRCREEASIHFSNTRTLFLSFQLVLDIVGVELWKRSKIKESRV